jgi:hypothetical protein
MAGKRNKGGIKMNWTFGISALVGIILAVISKRSNDWYVKVFMGFFAALAFMLALGTWR